MIEEQKMIVVESRNLLEKVKEYQEKGFRLVQINCTQLADCFEINYSFDKNFAFVNLRIILRTKDEIVPSVSPVYWSAFLYENEMHDLYGINFKDMALDYKGNFYRTTVKTPFLNPTPTPEGKGDVK